MDAVDPHLLEHAESAIRRHPAVEKINYVRMRWVGHCLHLESCITVDPSNEFSNIREIRNQIDGALLKELPHLSEITVSITPES